MAEVHPPADTPAVTEPNVRAEQTNLDQEWYDLQPSEKKFVRYLLYTGIVILVILLAVFGVLKIAG